MSDTTMSDTTLIDTVNNRVRELINTYGLYTDRYLMISECLADFLDELDDTSYIEVLENYRSIIEYDRTFPMFMNLFDISQSPVVCCWIVDNTVCEDEAFISECMDDGYPRWKIDLARTWLVR